MAFLVNLDACTAVVLPDVLDEVSAIADRLTLQSVDEGAGSLVEAICAADLKCAQSVSFGRFEAGTLTLSMYSPQSWELLMTTSTVTSAQFFSKNSPSI